MNLCNVSFSIWAVLCAALIGASAEPVLFQPKTNLMAGTAPLVAGTYAVPCVTDWNGDGRKDLLVGYRTTDKIALFLNIGSDESPAFSTFTHVQAGGTDIYVEGAPSCGSPAPTVCDFNGDGKRDLLVGSGKTGEVFFYQNTNADSFPILAPGVLLMAGALPLNVVYRAAPHVHDWDEDGLQDLLCGNGDGLVYWFKNTNTLNNPVYAAGTRLRAGGIEVNFGARSVPRMHDWDGDGLKDLVVSSSTGVYWCRNTNSNSDPALQAPAAFRAPLSGLGLQPINTSGRMRLELIDWNNDRCVDLLLGNVDGTIALFEGYHFAVTSISRASPAQLVLQWSSASGLRFQVLTGPSVTNIGTIVSPEVLSFGRTTQWTNSQQGALQFYRVQIAPP